MDGIVRLPEMLMACQGVARGSRIIVAEQSRGDSRTRLPLASSQLGGGKSKSQCLMHGGVMEELAAQGIHVHHSPPDNPSVASVDQRAQNGQLPLVEGQGGAGKEYGEEAHAGDERKPVVAKLLLGAVLMEAPVVFDALSSARHDFGSDRIARHFDQGIIVLKQRTHHHVSGKPHFILTGHSKLCIFHHGDGLLLLGRGESVFEQDEGRAQRFRDAYLVVPPVQAHGSGGKPIVECPVNRSLHFRGMMISGLLGAVEFHQLQDALGMEFGLPSRAFFIFVINVGPRSGIGERRHIGCYLLHIERIALVQLHYRLVRHFLLRRDGGKRA